MMRSDGMRYVCMTGKLSGFLFFFFFFFFFLDFIKKGLF